MATIINTDFIRQHPTQAVLTVLGLSGVAAVFLPFYPFYVPVFRIYETYVPLEVLLDSPLDDLFSVVSVGPFVVLPFFIFAGYLRWLLTGRLSRWESTLGYALALIGALGLPVYVLYDSSGSLDKGDWLGLLSLVVYAANAWYIAQSERSGMSPAPPALAAMQIVYLMFALYWLTLLVYEASNVRLDAAGSAACRAVTVLAYTVQAALLVRGQRWKLLRLVPLALLWGLWGFMLSMG